MDALVQGTAHMAGHAWHGTSNLAQSDFRRAYIQSCPYVHAIVQVSEKIKKKKNKISDLDNTHRHVG
jgi:hypothetical protein